MAQLPQPLVVQLNSPSAPKEAPSPNWVAVTTHLRDTTKWIVGGIVATCAAVIAGSSLTNIGSLTPAEDLGRLGLAGGGAAVGFLAVGLLFAKALAVFDVPSTSLDRIAAAQPRSKWAPLRAQIEEEFALPAAGTDSLAKLVAANTDERLAQMEAMAPYLYVHGKFRTMVRWLPGTVLGAAIGFGVFAWAANPPEDPRPTPPPRPAVFVFPTASPAS